MDSAVLISAGLDSAVLVAERALHGRVHPFYVRAGLAWEDAERRMLGHLLAAPIFAGAAPLETLDAGMRGLYPPAHWAVRGAPPAYDTPDEDVYLAGRNLVLLTRAGVAAAARGIGTIALGPLAGNPFPDATPEFFQAMARALSLGLDRPIEIVTPLAALHKEAVIRLGVSLGVPLELTLSCMNPEMVLPEGLPGRGERDGLPRHCGLCSKCRERRDGFAAAGIADPTLYALPSPR